MKPPLSLSLSPQFTHSFLTQPLSLSGLNLRTYFTVMATRMTARFVSRTRRLYSSGSGKILSEEEKAAENVYIKKIEQEKLEKLARKGPQPEEKAAAGSGGSVTGAKASSGSTGTSADEKVSTDKYRNYAVIAGTITIFGALGWYLKGTAKKPEAQD